MGRYAWWKHLLGGSPTAPRTSPGQRSEWHNAPSMWIAHNTAEVHAPDAGTECPRRRGLRLRGLRRAWPSMPRPARKRSRTAIESPQKDLLQKINVLLGTPQQVQVY